jgi:hypothetical protein
MKKGPADASSETPEAFARLHRRCAGRSSESKQIEDDWSGVDFGDAPEYRGLDFVQRCNRIWRRTLRAILPKSEVEQRTITIERDSVEA